MGISYERGTPVEPASHGPARQLFIPGVKIVHSAPECRTGLSIHRKWCKISASEESRDDSNAQKGRYRGTSLKRKSPPPQGRP